MSADKKQQKQISNLLGKINNEVNALFSANWSYCDRRQWIDISDEDKERIYQYRRLQYLKRKKWIKIKKTEEGLLCSLTQVGKKELQRREIIKKKEKLPAGQKCLVMFDIPEDARSGRHALRQFLKNADFKRIQLSVWESDRDIGEEVKKFIKRAGVSKWVIVFVGKKL